ncbi:ComEA family DNA-binding protein [Candidatus Woesearchaeota archaeon]|nr:ComEA family DNA-binding protein [Candidatus Woesearchaeota archaeon]
MYRFSKLLITLGLLCGSLMATAESLDINTATIDQFDQVMVGVGRSKAEAIVKDRETNGPFKSVDDMTRVKGIGTATLQQNRDKLTTSAAATPPPTTPTPASAAGTARTK